MQTTIIHTCGHRETTHLYGSREERERREKWLDSQPCRECRNAAQTQAAQQQAEVDHLPTLTGSEKQVAWATTLRTQALTQTQQWIADTLASQQRRGATAEQIASVTAQAAQATAALTQQVSASWWIDHRSDTTQGRVKAAMALGAK